MANTKGHFFIKNAAGTVKLGGLAVLTNDTPSARWTEVTDVMEHNDSRGVPGALSRNFRCFEISFRLTPGVGSGLASLAATVGAATGIYKGDQFISTSFQFPELNVADADKAIIWSIGGDQAENALGGLDVTVRKYITCDSSPAVIDFTGAWAQI